MTRPAYHYRPAMHWINDPNGLCQVDGWYHLFYQYNPHGSEWGDIHWGHARSRDMLRWEDLPVALTPRTDAGEIHCFSGSCCKDAEGRPHFFYTSIGRKEDGRDCTDGAQQWMAEPADAGLTRLAQTDAYALTDTVHGMTHVREWRDPCVIPWEGQYLMVLGGCLEGRGCVLLYTSPDMRHWRYLHVLAQSQVQDDVPWECPNLFYLDGKWVLFYSPCAQVMVQVGTMDDTLHFHCEREEVLDPGGRQGYYAPQAFRDETGRSILMGWMPECDGEGAVRKGWSGVMSLPRLMRVEDSRLLAQPLPGVDDLADWHEVTVQAGSTCIAENGRRMLLWLRTSVLEGPLVLRMFASADGCQETVLSLTPDGVLTLDRSRSSTEAEICRTPIRRTVVLNEGQAEVFLALDESTVECAVNGQWLSGRVYPGDGCSRVWVECAGVAEGRIGHVGDRI